VFLTGKTGYTRTRGQCWVVTRYKVTRYCIALLLGVTSPVTRYYLPGVTLSLTSYFLK